MQETNTATAMRRSTDLDLSLHESHSWWKGVTGESGLLLLELEGRSFGLLSLRAIYRSPVESLEGFSVDMQRFQLQAACNPVVSNTVSDINVSVVSE